MAEHGRIQNDEIKKKKKRPITISHNQQWSVEYYDETEKTPNNYHISNHQT